jgi:hypothetical protein
LTRIHASDLLLLGSHHLLLHKKLFAFGLESADLLRDVELLFVHTL